MLLEVGVGGGLLRLVELEVQSSLVFPIIIYSSSAPLMDMLGGGGVVLSHFGLKRMSRSPSFFP